MPQAKFSKAFPYRGMSGRKFSGTMTEYPAGYEGDIPQAHYDAAVEANAIEGETPPTAKDTAKDSGKSK